MNVLTVPIEIPEKLLPILDTKARYIVLIGGRGSAKSESVSRVMMMKAENEGSDLLCGREYQNSIDESVHKLNCEIIESLGIPGAYTTEKKIDFASGGQVRYKGFARNSAAVKSAQGFKRSWVEEAQDLSQQSITDLLPTIRASGSQLFFTANPQASNDPFSQRFIIPFKHILDKHGIYQDDMHLIIVVNWRDNPWFPDDLNKERLWDYEHKSRAEYDHIWEGAFNDSIENSIIKAEWFDAAIDAHKKLGFKPRGAKIVAHDPADSIDPKGYYYRHGNVVMDVRSKEDGDVNDGCDWATDLAIEVGADLFVWDGDGLGVSLRRQVAESFEGKKIEVRMFKGSESPANPDAIYQPDERLERKESRTNADTFLNKRAQRYIGLRDRFFNTYRAVIKKEYIDPNLLISISSEIECIDQFRSEVCRIPLKSNGRGLIQIMRKDEMKNKLKIASPNLADSAMMGEEAPSLVKKKETKPITIPNMNRL
jgi:phage terminase large subunit